MVMSTFSCLFFNASAAFTEVASSYDEDESGNRTVYWTYFEDKSTSPVIGRLVIYKYRTNEDGVMVKDWGYLDDKINIVIFSGEVDVVPTRLFYGMDKITDVTFGPNVREICSYAFNECTSLKSVELPDLLHTVGEYAFYGCTSITDVTLGSGLCDTSVEGAGEAYIGQNAFKNCTSLKTLTVKNGCKQIGYGMFENCTALEDVVLPDSVESIGAHAFENCASFIDIVIPDSVVSVGDFAYNNCSSAKTASLGHNLTEIGAYLFDNCTSLEKVTFNTGATKVSEGMFYNCSSLTDIALVDGITEIGDCAFEKCSSLEEITIPFSVTKIGDSAFDSTALKTIDIPQAVAEIGAGAFTNCADLTDINVDSKNRNYKSYNGALYSGDYSSLICCPPAKSGAYTVYSAAEKIADDAFIGCDKLTVIEIPDSVTEISASAFNGCADDLVIKCSCNSIAVDYAAKYGIDCEITKHNGNKIWEVVKEAGCEEDGEKQQVCDACDTVFDTEVIPALGHTYDAGVITKAATCEADGVFTYTCTRCNKTRTEVIPATGHEYDEGTVTKAATCEAEGVITYKCTNEGCKNKYTEAIPALGHNYDDGVVTKAPTCEANGVMTYTCQNEGCKKKYTEEIPALEHIWDAGVVTKDATCTEEGVKTFTCTQDGCKKTYTEKIPATGHKWDKGTITKPCTQYENGERTFTCSECGETKTETLVFTYPNPGRYDISDDGTEILKKYWELDGKTLYIYENIGNEWVGYSNVIEKVVAADNATILPAYAFYKYPNLKKADIDNIDEIGAYAFNDCDALTDVSMDPAIIGEYAFYDCDAIEDICLGKVLQSADKNIFKDCDKLSNVEFENGCKVVGYGMFENCTALKDFILPDSIDEIGAHAFENCQSFVDIVIPDSVKSVGDYAYYNCSSAKSAYLGHNLEAAGKYLFGNCTSLEKATFKTSIDAISVGMFYNCSSLKDVELVDGLETIGNIAFEKCSALAEIEIPFSVKVIGDSAFDSTALETVFIPQQVEEIGAGAFTNCANLTDINVDAKNRNYKSYNGVLYSGDYAQLLCCPPAKSGDYTVYEACLEIVDDAFIGCDKLTSVTIPEDVQAISASAFNGCSEDLILKSCCNSLAAAYADHFDIDFVTTYHNGDPIWVITKEPTCLNKGIEAFLCEACGHVYDSKPIDALGHAYNSGEVTKAATCEKDGVMTYTCERCGHTYTETIEAIGHFIGEGVVTKPATCEADGIMTFACQNEGCKKSYTEVIPATGHNFDNGTVTKAATCEKDGVKTYRCRNEGCYKAYTEVIPALGHIMDNGIVVVEPTCTEDGLKRFSCINSGCSESYTEVIPATGHKYGEGKVVKPATCTDTGIMEYTCENCGDVKQEIIPVTHLSPYSTWTVQKKATCTEDGLKVRGCAVCGGVVESEVIPATGHNFVNGICKNCGEYDGTTQVLSQPTLDTVGNYGRGCFIRWKKVKGAEGYNIYRKTTGSYVKIATVDDPSLTEFIDTTSKNGTVYTYSVSAYNSKFETSYNKTGLSYRFITSPKLVSAENVYGGVKFTWQKVSGVKSYYVYRRVNDGAWQRIAIVTGENNVTYTDKTAQSGTNCKYTVRGYVGSCRSSYYSGGKTTHYLTTPELVSCENSAKSPVLKWKTVKDADGYYVYRKTANTGWTRIAAVKGNTKNSYSDTTAKAGTKYTYTVRAYHSSFRSYFVTKGISCTYLPAPTLISAKRASGGVTIKYSKVSQATSYYIYRKTLNGDWQRIAVVKGAANTTFVDTTAKKGTTYNYTVRAYKSPSRSAYTGYLSVK